MVVVVSMVGVQDGGEQAATKRPSSSDQLACHFLRNELKDTTYVLL